MENTATELKESEARQRSLGTAFESLNAQASSILLFTMEWKELEDHFESTRNSLRTRFEELQERAKGVAELEAKELSFKSEMESKAQELGEIQELIEQKRQEAEQGKRYLQSIESLIEENNEELKIKENRYSDVEKSIRGKERELEGIDKHVKERSRKLNWVEKREEVKLKEVESMERKVKRAKDVLIGYSKDTELEEKRLNNIRGLIEEKRKELDLKEDQMMMAQRSIGDCDSELKGKEERLRLIEESIANCSKTLQLKEELISAVDLKAKDFSLLKKSMEEWSCKLEVKERELEGWVAKLESKEKQVESRVQELNLIHNKFLDEVQLKEKHLDSLEKSLLAWEKDLHLLQKSVQECSQGREITMDRRGLQQFMDEHLKRIDSMGTELSAILKESSDPAKLVLDAMQGFYPDNRELNFELRVRRRICCLLLEELKRISPQINPEVREEATKLAANWKAKMTVASDNDSEVLGFLRLLIAYDLTSIYDAKELKRLLSSVSHGQQSAQIDQALGITAPGSRIICSPLNIEEPESSMANNAATISSPNPQPSATTDAKDLLGFINETLSWNSNTIQNQMVASVQSAPDPEKLVLKIMQNSFINYWTSGEASFKKSVMSCNISLLEVLMRVSPQVGSHVKEDATKLALQWKAKIRADTEHLLEIVGFMLFITAYGLLPTLNGDEIVKILERLSQHKAALESYQMRGFPDKILAVFIQTLVERKQLFQALGFIFAFKLLDKFPPVQILKEYVNDVMKCWTETLKRKKSVDEKVEFVDGQIADLRAVFRCIKEYNLDSEYPSMDIAVEIVELEKLTEIWRSSEKCLASIAGQQEQSRGKKRSSITSAPTFQQGQQQKSKFHRTTETAPSPYRSPIFTPVLLQSGSSSLAYGKYGRRGQFGNMTANSSEVDRSSSLAYEIHGHHGQFGNMAANSSEVYRSSSLAYEIHGHRGQFGNMAANSIEVDPCFGAIDELNLIEKRVNESLKEVQLKEKDFDAREKSIEEGRKHLVSLSNRLQNKEWQLRKQAKELKLEKQEFDSIKKSSEEQTQGLKSKEEANILHSESKMTGDCRGLQLFMNEQLKRIDLMSKKLFVLLQASSDPAKLVLDAMQGFHPSNSNLDSREIDFDLEVTRRSCLVMLKELERMSPQINPLVREEAIKLATEWKAKMTVTAENRLEILGFLQLVTTYELISLYDAKELRSLLTIIAQPKQATELCRVLDISDKAYESSISPPPVKVEEQESSLDKNAPTFSSPNLQPSATVHARNSPGFLNEQSIWKHSIQNKIFVALEKSLDSDPAKLVLDLMQISFAGYWTKGDAHCEATSMKSFISLLETVTRVLLHVGPQVKEDAIELAVQWKTKLKADTENSLEILGFLQFIATYGLLSMFTIDEIVKLLGMISQHTQALELCQTLGFADRIPDFIRDLIQGKQLVEAVRLICTFKLTDKFAPAPLLHEYVEDTWKRCSEICTTEISVDEKDKVVDGQIADLRDVIQCINKYNLEFEYQSAAVEKQIQELRKLKENWRLLVPSVEPQDQNRGKKRRSLSTSAPMFQPQQLVENNRQMTAVSAARPPHALPTFSYPQSSSSAVLRTNYGLPGQFGMPANGHQFATNYGGPLVPPMKRPCMMNSGYPAPFPAPVPFPVPVPSDNYGLSNSYRFPHPNRTQFWR